MKNETILLSADRTEDHVFLSKFPASTVASESNLEYALAKISRCLLFR